MKKIKTMLLALLIGLWGLSATAVSQNQSDRGPTFRAAVKQVYLAVRVFKKGQAVGGLTKENFRVWEITQPEGKPERIEQSVEDFSSYQDQSIALAVMIDSSESMGDLIRFDTILAHNKLELARLGAKNLLETIFRPGVDRGLTSEFSLEVYQVFENERYVTRVTNLLIRQDWTSDLASLVLGLEKITKAGGNTPMRDALFNLAQHCGGVEGRFSRIIVLLSDGEDNPSVFNGRVINQHSLPEVIGTLQNQQVMVFGIGVYKKNFQWPVLGGPDFLETVATATGGQAFYSDNGVRLLDVFREIGDMIRDLYFISYTPKSDTEGPRTIEVETGERNEKGDWHKQKVTLFYRKGYIYRK